MRGEGGGQGRRRFKEAPRRPSESEDEDSEGSTASSTPHQLSHHDPEETVLETFTAAEYPEEDEDEEDALELVVETLLGESYRVKVSQWDTAAGLKELLYRTQGISPNHQHLILGDRELVDDACLIEQQVTDGSTLRLVVAVRGGPINARRLPSHEDLLWRDLTDYMDGNSQELWEGVGGRTVTLLVLRDGENVNLYRVVENQDGSYSPLNESWASVGSGRGEDAAAHKAQLTEEEARTRARMGELRMQMDELRVRNKKKKEKRKTVTSSQQSLSSSMRSVHDHIEEIISPRPDLSDGSILPGGGGALTPRKRSGVKRLANMSRRGGRGSRPTTQERLEFHKSNHPRPTLKELPSANPPVPIDFTRRKPLEAIRPQVNRGRLEAVEELRGRGERLPQLPDSPNTVMRKNNFESYHKSIVNHGKGMYGARAAHGGLTPSAHEAWPTRDLSKPPLYMLPETSKPGRYDQDRLNHSHNQDLLRSAQHTAGKRPKTSPEVLERRPSTTGDQSAISERILLRAPDDRLREVCSILGQSRGSSRQSQRLNSPPESILPPLSLSTSLTGSNLLSRSHKTNSVSVSLASLRTRGATPPSPGQGALVTSGSRDQRDAIRGLMRSQGGASRRPTPEEASPRGRRPESGRMAPAPSHLPPVTPKRRKGRRKPRCEQCSCRLGVATTYECRCGGIFCAQHRYAETHTCTFDYRTAGRALLQLANPLVAPNRIPKM